MKKDKKEILKQDIESYLEKRAGGKKDEKNNFSFFRLFKKLADSKKNKSPKEPANSIISDHRQGAGKSENERPESKKPADKEKNEGLIEELKKDSVRLMEIRNEVLENLKEPEKSRLTNSEEFKKLSLLLEENINV